MAEETQRLGASMIHYSTDFVFDGERRHPYTESSITNPISVYGRSKLEGEQAVAKMCHRHVVLRTSWLFSQHGHNFLKTILRLASERDELRVVADQEGSPTSTELVAAVTLRVAKALRVADTDDRRWGLYHVAATGHTTWYEYARYAIEKARESGAAIRVAPDRIRPIGAAEYAAPASRPAYSVLDSSKLVRVFDMDLMDWQEGVDRERDECFPISQEIEHAA